MPAAASSPGAWTIRSSPAWDGTIPTTVCPGWSSITSRLKRTSARGSTAGCSSWRQRAGTTCIRSSRTRGREMAVQTREQLSREQLIDRLLLRTEVEDFLYHEAELLDERRYSEWVDLVAD